MIKKTPKSSFACVYKRFITTIIISHTLSLFYFSSLNPLQKSHLFESPFLGPALLFLSIFKPFFLSSSSCYLCFKVHCFCIFCFQVGDWWVIWIMAFNGFIYIFWFYFFIFRISMCVITLPFSMFIPSLCIHALVLFLFSSRLFLFFLYTRKFHGFKISSLHKKNQLSLMLLLYSSAWAYIHFKTDFFFSYKVSVLSSDRQAGFGVLCLYVFIYMKLIFFFTISLYISKG